MYCFLWILLLVVYLINHSGKTCQSVQANLVNQTHSILFIYYVSSKWIWFIILLNIWIVTCTNLATIIRGNMAYYQWHTFVHDFSLISSIQQPFFVLSSLSCPPVITIIGDFNPVTILAARPPLSLGHCTSGWGLAIICQC